MPSRPITLTNGDFQLIAPGDLDPASLPSTVVLTDGTKPFTAPQTGVAATAPNQLTTLAQVTGLAGSAVWIGPVLSATTTAQPGSPSTGDRYILPVGATGAAWAGHDKAIATWTGSAWSFATPVAGMVSYVIDIDILVRYSGSLTTWGDASVTITHNSVKSLQGGTTGERLHLTQAEHDAVSGSKAAHSVLAAPTGGAGVLTPRLLDASDIQSGLLPGTRGGLGVDASAATGYGLWASGSLSFSATIPWGSLSGVPSSFTPSAHAASHVAAGSDPLSLSAVQITTGLMPLARGGTNVDGSSVAPGRVLASPVASTGPLSLRQLLPDDITGASAAFQVIMRNAGNTGNVWQIISSTSLGAVPTSRVVATPNYLSGGGALSADLSLDWRGLDVQQAGSTVARYPILNFTNATVAADPGNNRVNVTVTTSAPAPRLNALVAAIAMG